MIPASHGLDLHLQTLPVAPGLTPSQALDPLEGVRDVVNCGLDFLNTAKNCGLSATDEVVSPFSVSFDPMYCRLTLRFQIGALIDSLLKQWIAGALADLDTPVIGALCLLGIGARYCGSTSTPSTSTSSVVPQSLFQSSGSTGGAATPATNNDDATALDRLTR